MHRIVTLFQSHLRHCRFLRTLYLAFILAFAHLILVYRAHCLFRLMAKRKGKETKQEEVIQLGPTVAPGEDVFGVAHIFASFNDTFVHVTDLSGK